MLQIHLDIDISDKRQLAMVLAAFNAIADFAMHAEPVHGPAPADAASPPARGRKPKGNSGQAQQPEADVGQWPQQPPPPPPMGDTLGGAPDLKTQLHSELRNFSTVCGPMALQGLLAYFGSQRASDLPMERADEIFQYIRAARAQQAAAQVQQGPGMQ